MNRVSAFRRNRAMKNVALGGAAVVASQFLIKPVTTGILKGAVGLYSSAKGIWTDVVAEVSEIAQDAETGNVAKLQADIAALKLQLDQLAAAKK